MDYGVTVDAGHGSLVGGGVEEAGGDEAARARPRGEAALLPAGARPPGAGHTGEQRVGRLQHLVVWTQKYLSNEEKYF